MAISNQHCNAIKQYIGESSREHAEALYLKAKAMSMDPDAPPDQAMNTIKRSIHIWKNIPLSGGPKDLNHAMALLLKASILARHMKKYRWAVKVYRKASLIIYEIEGAKMNITTLLNNVIAECEMAMKLAEQDSGEPIDIDALSEEEDADYIEDN